jgi:hypothetical protein
VQVAIFDQDAHARQACLKEVKILSSVEHPNIINIVKSFIEVGEESRDHN